jgi:radical SAM protein with 4Fe4S-binding SPASM domain
LLTLSGGEPTLRSDWSMVAQAAVGAGITTNLVTNGQGPGRQLAQRSRAAGLANVAVSLDGLRSTHDAIRAPGSFDSATACIAELASAGLWVDVMFTTNRLNLDELPELFELARKLGARGLRVQIGKPMGRQTGRDELTLSPRSLLALLPTLGRLAATGGPVVRIGDSVGFFSEAERALRGATCEQGHWTGCYAGCQAIGLQSDGGVKGCLSLQPRAGESDPFIEGNLRERSLADIWHAPGAFAYNREPNAVALTDACASCTHRALCRGGAKCVAYAYTGTLGCDPMCYMQAAGAKASERSRIWPTSAAAASAAALLALGLDGPGGCGSDVTTEGSGGAGGTPTTTSGGGHASGGAPADAGPDADAAPDCSTVCCLCEYGVQPPPEVFKACCCEGVCCACDYGVQPPAGCCP